MTEDVEFKAANQLPGTVQMNVVINTDYTVSLDEEEIEKLEVNPGELVNVSVSKIPKEKEGDES